MPSAYELKSLMNASNLKNLTNAANVKSVSSIFEQYKSQTSSGLSKVTGALSMDKPATAALNSSNFADKAKSLTGSGSNVNNLTSGIMANAQKMVPGLDASKLSGVMNSPQIQNVAKQATGAIQSVIAKLSSSAGSILGNSLGNLSKMFPTASTDIFAKLTPNAPIMSAITGDMSKGKKETDSKIKTFGASSAEAISSPVSFISKPLNDLIRGIDAVLPGGVNTVVRGLSSLSKGNLSKATGMSITDDASVNVAMNSVTSEFANRLISMLDANSSIFQFQMEGSTGSAQQYNSQLLSSLARTLTSNGRDPYQRYTGSSYSGSSRGSSYLSSSGAAGVDYSSNSALSMYLGDAITQSELEGALPQDYRNMLSAGSNTRIEAAANQYVNSKTRSVSNIQEQFNNVGDQDELTNFVLGLSGNYPSLQGQNFQTNAGIYGTAEPDMFDLLYELAATICPNIRRPDSVEFSNLKDLYDTLIDQAANSGLADLIRQLVECGQELGLFDERTAGMLKDRTTLAAVTGGVFVLGSIIGALGTYSVSDPARLLMITNANMYGYPEEIVAYEDLSKTLNVTTTQIVTTNIGGRTVYNGERIAMMSTSNTKIIDKGIGTPTRKLSNVTTTTYKKTLAASRTKQINSLRGTTLGTLKSI